MYDESTESNVFEVTWVSEPYHKSAIVDERTYRYVSIRLRKTGTQGHVMVESNETLNNNPRLQVGDIIFADIHLHCQWENGSMKTFNMLYDYIIQ